MRKLPPLKSRGRPWGRDRRNQALQWVWRTSRRRTPLVTEPALLLEDGSHLQLEDGSNLLLE